MIAWARPSQMSTEVDYLFFKTCYNRAQIKTFKEEACPLHRRSMLASSNNMYLTTPTKAYSTRCKVPDVWIDRKAH